MVEAPHIFVDGKAKDWKRVQLYPEGLPLVSYIYQLGPCPKDYVFFKDWYHQLGTNCLQGASPTKPQQHCSLPVFMPSSYFIKLGCFL